MSIRQLSLQADADNPSLRFDYGADPNNEKTFDRDSILGCQCDPGYQGYDCSQRTFTAKSSGLLTHGIDRCVGVADGEVSCPIGDDPTTTGQVDEVQLIKCVASGGTFQLLYRTSGSADIPFDAPPSVLRSLLISSFQFEDIDVQYSSGSQACSPASATVQNVIRVTFTLVFGDVPPLRAGSTALIGTLPTLQTAENGASINGIMSQAGTKERAVCSNKGYCNFDLGECVCATGYASSDGRGNIGNRGDCGFRLANAVVVSS
jgi:hypothetical protein